MTVFSPQVDGATVGFISVTADVDLKQLHHNFELSEFNNLYKLQQTKHDASAPTEPREDEEETTQTQTSASHQVTEL